MRPTLATPNQVRLDLRTMVLRDYGKPGGIPTLVDAPHAGHTAMIADYHKGQSLVETLLKNVTSLPTCISPGAVRCAGVVDEHTLVVERDGQIVAGDGC